MRVFFYGLFMDKTLLATKGIRPSHSVIGHVDGFRIRIGERATLLRSQNGRAYGVMMDIDASDAETLYSEDSVADYLPESVCVKTQDGSQFDATCYNLPIDRIAGSNKKYAESLLVVATKLGFPKSYLDQIQQAGSKQ